MVQYRPRTVDSAVAKSLNTVGAVHIQGIRGCGKTTTGRQFSRSQILISDHRNPGILNMARDNPAMILEGETPRLIDEWQLAPTIWDAVRNEVDARAETGQFILTGSAVPNDDRILHSGTGRMARVMMRTMSLYESGESDGTVSLSGLFDGGTAGLGQSPLDLNDVVRLMARGGWPFTVNSNQTDGAYAAEYVKGVAESDVSRVDGVRRSPDTVMTLLRSLARNTGTMASISTLVDDIANYGGDVSDKTVISYINALARIFVVENLDSWNPHLRSKASIRSSPKRMLADPSIAIAAMNLDAEGLLDDYMYLGLLFESLCVRDLRCYAQAIGGTVRHYRDSHNLEVDCVVQLGDGRWGAVEVKLGDSGVEKGAANLKKLGRRIDDSRMRPPSFLMVLTATGMSYTRSDGIVVTPIGCLGP